MISVVDYEMGNLGSIINMFKRLGVRAKQVRTADEIRDAEKLVLPGVGHWNHGMAQLNKLGLRRSLEEVVMGRKIPTLGICLGMQLMTRRSEEGDLPGLGWVAADTVHFRRGVVPEAQNLKLPHIGWNFIDTVGSHPLVESLLDEPRFYFVHSYRVVCDNPDDVLIESSYGSMDFVAAYVHGNVVGVQFHPEKSHKFGMRLLKNFAAWAPSVPSQQADQ